MSLMKRLWNDEAGFVVSAELILIATIAVLGLIVALDTVRNAVTSELADVSGAIQNVNQSYVIQDVVGHSSSVAGSDFIDQLDFCDEGEDVATTDLACIVHSGPAAPNELGAGAPTPVP